MNFILSQIFVTLAYVFIGATYLIKNRKATLVLSTISTIMFCSSYAFLHAWAGVAMNVVAVIRNGLFSLNGKFKKNPKTLSCFTLIFINLLFVICGIFTYAGLLSLMCVFASIIYTVGIWQTNTKIYKCFGIISSFLWITYNAFVGSTFGIIFETIMVICAIVGLFIENNKKKGEQQNGEDLFGESR